MSFPGFQFGGIPQNVQLGRMLQQPQPMLQGAGGLAPGQMPMNPGMQQPNTQFPLNPGAGQPNTMFQLNPGAGVPQPAMGGAGQIGNQPMRPQGDYQPKMNNGSPDPRGPQSWWRQ